VKLLAPLLAGLLLAGCGTQTGAGPAASGSGPSETTPSTEKTDANASRPPDIVLSSAAGKQFAVLGSYCLHTSDSGVCADSAPPHPKEVSVVPVAEHLTFSLVGASFAGVPSVTVRPLGCERKEIITVNASSSQALALDLPRGDYQLDVSARFRDGAGGSAGDVSGSAGLVVDPQARARIEPAPPGRTGC
jgi:hypothetical protein